MNENQLLNVARRIKNAEILNYRLPTLDKKGVKLSVIWTVYIRSGLYTFFWPISKTKPDTLMLFI